MLAAVFFVTVIAVLGVTYVLMERPRAKAAAGHPRPLSLADVVGLQPAGVFLQPTFTWSRVMPNGNVEIGIHPLLLALVGEKPSLNLRASGEHLQTGEYLAGVGTDGRALAIRSPISGRIVVSNDRADTTAGWLGAWDNRGNWVYRVEPDDLASSVPGWLVAERAAEWTRHEYGRIRDHLLRANTAAETGVALADGGEIPYGVLDQLSPEAWQQFEESFLRA